MAEQVEVKDIFEHNLEPGDIFVYCPGSKRNASLRVGVFIEHFINKNGQPKVKVQLITDRGRERSFAMIKPEIFSERCALVSNPFFHVSSKLMANAIEAIETLKIEGVLPDFIDSPSQNPESV